jgi:hypothetical protein
MPEKLSQQTIKHILKDIQTDVKELKELAKITNGRIKSLELWRARILGGIAVITMFLVPIILQYLSKFVSAYFN